jgi:DNA-binding MarR family transcriptional regulator
MDSEIPNLILRALRRILRATETGSRAVASATGLTTSQLLVLREIETREQPTPSVLAHALQFSQATITIIVDRLVTRGFVTRQRDERDKRQIILTVTPEGEDAVRRAPDILQLEFQKRLTALPAWEQAMILAAVEKLAAILGAENIDAAPLLDGGAIDRSGPH